MMKSLRSFEIYFDMQRNRCVLGYEGIGAVPGMLFMFKASPEMVDEEISKRERVNREHRFAFEFFGIDMLDVAADMFQKSEEFLDAVAKGNEVLAAELLAAGADINYQTEDGKTALMIAARHGLEGHFSMVQFLVENGAELYIEDDCGLIALDYAREVRDEESWSPYVAEFLEEAEQFGDVGGIISSAKDCEASNKGMDEIENGEREI